MTLHQTFAAHATDSDLPASGILATIEWIKEVDAIANFGYPDLVMALIDDEQTNLISHLTETPCTTAEELAAKLRLTLSYVEDGERIVRDDTRALLADLADDWQSVQDARRAARIAAA